MDLDLTMTMDLAHTTVHSIAIHLTLQDLIRIIQIRQQLFIRIIIGYLIFLI